VSEPRIRVILADDHTLVRTGLHRILDAHADIDVVAEAATGDETLALVRQDAPDVLVLDLNMPGGDGLNVLRQVRLNHDALRVVVLTMHAGREYVGSAVRAGADAYLLKDSAVQDLVAAIRAVHAGRRYFSPAVQSLMADWMATPGADDRPRGITVREREVLTWLAQGLSSRAVAARLAISVRTVETHRASLMQKLDVKSVAMLIQAAIREGLIDPPGTTGPQ
jgi:DNA-binding NarL/FixJ family response regulator